MNKKVVALLLMCVYVTAGCGPKRSPGTVVLLLDPTYDYVKSPRGVDGWSSGLEIVRRELQSAPSGTEVDFYSFANAEDFTPKPLFVWRKDIENGKSIISARGRRQHNQELVSNADHIIQELREHPVIDQTRLVESLYEVSRSNCERSTVGNSEIVLASDMEPYAGPLTCGHIVESELSLQRACRYIESNYPRLRGAPQVTVVYSPSTHILKEPPVEMERLKRFWTFYFSKVGCKFDWVSPDPVATRHGGAGNGRRGSVPADIRH